MSKQVAKTRKSKTPTWDKLGTLYQDNILRQHREGGIKVVTNPVLQEKVETALESHTKDLKTLKEQLAKVEEALNKATLAKDLRQCRDNRITILSQIADATKTKRTTRDANEDYADLKHNRAYLRASEFMRLRQVVSILGELKDEPRRDTDEAEIAEYEQGKKVAKARAQIVGSLDLSDFQ